MGTKKGLLTKDDADRYTEKHLEICKWFLSNANLFVRCFLYDRPVGEVKVILEQLVTGSNGFSIGYADVLLSSSTDQGDIHLVLIEVKTRLRDQAEALRQLNTYQNYLPKITKKCLVHSDPRFKSWWNEQDGRDLSADFSMRDTFASQGIYVADYESLLNGFYIPDWCCAFPSGRREVVIDWVREEGERIHMQLSGTGVDRHGHDCVSAAYLFLPAPFSSDLWRLCGRQKSDGGLDQLRNIDCFIDVSHQANSSGFTEEKYSALHTRDMTFSVKLK